MTELTFEEVRKAYIKLLENNKDFENLINTTETHELNLLGVFGYGFDAGRNSVKRVGGGGK